VLSIDVFWHKKGFFRYLEKKKAEAIKHGKEIQGIIRTKEEESNWPFTIKPHGSRGYEWILTGKEYSFLIGNWHTPQSKPSIMAEIRSETLWNHGAENAVEYLLFLLESAGSLIHAVKLSRVDVCIDVLLPGYIWGEGILKYKVTRATKTGQYYTHNDCEGLSIGKDKILCRIYDKELEIHQQSRKFWMFDIWGISKAPKNSKIIRVEFQIRREVIKELGLNTVNDLFDRIADLWVYCTEKWLKFQTRPGKHHTQRTTLPWWEVVQQGFKGDQGENPLIRSKTFSLDKDQHVYQILGSLTSLQALRYEESEKGRLENIDLFHLINGFIYEANVLGINEMRFDEIVKVKRARFHRHSNQIPLKG